MIMATDSLRLASSPWTRSWLPVSDNSNVHHKEYPQLQLLGSSELHARLSLRQHRRLVSPSVKRNQSGFRLLSSNVHSAELQTSNVHSAELQEKAKEILEDLNGTCIYLIGMIGNEKANIGRTLAQALGYYFFESDDLVVQAADGDTDIFNDEEGFRDAETEVLRQLSAMGRLVVATGAGSVVRSENWGLLHHGIVVWIDMPLQSLPVVTVRTMSPPLIPSNCADDEVLAEVSKLYEERRGAYGNADTTVSIQDVLTMLDIENPSELTPTMIALEVLKEIGELIRRKKQMVALRY